MLFISHGLCFLLGVLSVVVFRVVEIKTEVRDDEN